MGAHVEVVHQHGFSLGVDVGVVFAVDGLSCNRVASGKHVQAVHVVGEPCQAFLAVDFPFQRHGSLARRDDEGVVVPHVYSVFGVDNLVVAAEALAAVHGRIHFGVAIDSGVGPATPEVDILGVEGLQFGGGVDGDVGFAVFKHGAVLRQGEVVARRHQIGKPGFVGVHSGVSHFVLGADSVLCEVVFFAEGVGSGDNGAESSEHVEAETGVGYITILARDVAQQRDDGCVVVVGGI